MECGTYILQPVGKLLLPLNNFLGRWRLWLGTNYVKTFAEEYWVRGEMVDKGGDMRLDLVLRLENLKIQIIGGKPRRSSLRTRELRRAIT